MNTIPANSSSSQMVPVALSTSPIPQVVKVEPKGIFEPKGNSDSECGLSRKVIALIHQISQTGPGFQSGRYDSILRNPKLENQFTQELTDALGPVLRKWLT